MNKDWWKKSVVYQIYPRSFCDSNGDGIGDINGITSKLDYLKNLGVDVIWISPVYQSPMRDNGYDISDYCAINPEFGTMADFDNMLNKAHELRLKIVMDLVVNHTSIEHPWFKEKPDYYIWSEKPNDWIAWFGGSAWSLDNATGKYFLHLFSPFQPDLNWDNPNLRQEIYSMMRFWLDKGIDGFRLDAISFISKPLDSKGNLHFPNGNVKKIIPNGPKIHEYLQEMRREVLDHYDVMTVGETGGVTVDEAIQYANAEGTELNMVFQFETVELDGGETFKWNDRKIVLTELKEVLSRWQIRLYNKAWNSLYWCNHDQPRIVTRLGDEGEYREKSVKMLAVCLHFMQGTPFIYQGEELGMTNTPFTDISDYRDLESINAYKHLVEETKQFSKEDMLRFMQLKSRDTSRTPMQWSDEPNAGFTNPETTPWIMINPNYTTINAKEQTAREDSVFKFYQKLINLRKTMDIITYGSYELLLSAHPYLFIYTRSYQDKKLLVVCNFSDKEIPLDLPASFSEKNILITNEDDNITIKTLEPYGAVVFAK